MVEYRARFCGTPASVRDARRAIVRYARQCGFAPSAVHEIALAAGEALANAVEHGVKSLGLIEVTCTFVDGVLSVDISDGGVGFDVERVASRHSDPSADRGFGIAIMHAVMDRVQFDPRGSTVRLQKRRAAASSASNE